MVRDAPAYPEEPPQAASRRTHDADPAYDGLLAQPLRSSALRYGRAIHFQTSRLATLRAFDWMKSRRGSTRSPIRVENVSSAESAWLILTCNSERASGSSVVSHSCSGFISPRPL